MNQQTQQQQVDIVIVGTGLVGATLAALLNKNTDREPLSIALIDANEAPEWPSIINDKPPSCDPRFNPSPKFDSRVVALSHASRQILTYAGAWSIIQSKRVCAYREMFVWDSEGTGNIHFSSRDIGCDDLGYIVENTIVLRAILDSMRESRQVKLMHNAGLKRVERQGQQMLLQLADGQQLLAPLIVAADGANSTLRELMGFRVRQWDYHQRAIVTTVQCEHSHQLTAWQSFLPSGPLAFLPLDHADNRYCSIVWSLESTLAEHNMSLTDDRFAAELGKAFEYRLGRIEKVDQRFCFPLKQRHAVDYTTANVGLIGDAAHTIHPLAGQGVNLGLLDAEVLATEIERALKRQLPLSEISLLKRYQRQRKRHNLEVMAVMEGLNRLFGSREPLIRWLRNSGLSKVNTLTPLKRWLAKQAMGLNGLQ